MSSNIGIIASLLIIIVYAGIIALGVFINYLIMKKAVEKGTYNALVKHDRDLEMQRGGRQDEL